MPKALQDKQVLKIRELHAKGVSKETIMKRYNISKLGLYQIITRRRHKDI